MNVSQAHTHLQLRTLPLFPVTCSSESTSYLRNWPYRKQGNANLTQTVNQVLVTGLILEPSLQVLINGSFTDTVHVVAMPRTPSTGFLKITKYSCLPLRELSYRQTYIIQLGQLKPKLSNQLS